MLSAAKPGNELREGLTPAACAAAAFPLIALCSCQAEVGASSSSLSLASVHVYAFSAPRQRAGAGRSREGPVGSKQTPLDGATRMAQASECRNSHLYYYSIKFALSTYATLFSVGAPVAFLSFLVFLPTILPPWVGFYFSVSRFPLPRYQILAAKPGAAKPLVRGASWVQTGQSWVKPWGLVDLRAPPWDCPSPEPFLQIPHGSESRFKAFGA